jgi:adenosylcobinamide-GDP ribazoletransferase
MRAFWVAMQLLTRLPTPRLEPAAVEEHGRSVLFYPLIGLLIGALIASVQQLLAAADPLLLASLLLLVWVLATGGLHLDGLADCADAWAGSHGERDQALRIMKDPASGPAGVTAVVVVLLLKCAALTVLLREHLWPALLIAPVLGRAAMAALFLTVPYVRPGGLGAAAAAHLPRVPVVVVLAVTALAVIGAGRIGVAVLAAGSAMWLVLRRMMLQRLGGATGDALGATCELVETAAVAAAAFAAGRL